MDYLRQEWCLLFPPQNHFISYHSNGTLCLVLTSWELNSSKVEFSRFLTSQLYSISHREVIQFEWDEIIWNTLPPQLSWQIIFWKCNTSSIDIDGRFQGHWWAGFFWSACGYEMSFFYKIHQLLNWFKLILNFFQTFKKFSNIDIT